jgi:hypothetical protein
VTDETKGINTRCAKPNIVIIVMKSAVKSIRSGDYPFTGGGVRHVHGEVPKKFGADF